MSLHDLHHNTSPPVAAPAPLPSSPGILSQTLNSIANLQVQSKPLYLGISDRYQNDANNSLIRRIMQQNDQPITKQSTIVVFKETTISDEQNNGSSAKNIKYISENSEYNLDNTQTVRNHANKTSEINESTENTDHIRNGIEDTSNEINKTDVTSVIFKATENPLRTSSADGILISPSTNLNSSPNSAQSAPATPVKYSIDYEKAPSPGKIYFTFIYKLYLCYKNV